MLSPKSNASVSGSVAESRYLIAVIMWCFFHNAPTIANGSAIKPAPTTLLRKSSHPHPDSRYLLWSYMEW